MTVTVATPAPAPSSSPTVAPTPVAVGQKAIDGTLAFTVKSSRTDNVVDWDEPDQVNAQGIFVLVIMQVENIGRSPQAFSADYQRLLDSEGREYSPDMRATTREYAGHINIDINPGNTAPAGLVFDVPSGTQPNQYLLLLHASLYSPGVTLAIPPPPPPPTFAPTVDDDQRFLQKLASENAWNLQPGQSPIWTANPALAINVAHDACRSIVQKRHMTGTDFGALGNALAQRWGIDREVAGDIVTAAIETYNPGC
jgi:Domain of unknown function (DUF4352)/Protein of unknown function (DUF732)